MKGFYVMGASTTRRVRPSVRAGIPHVPESLLTPAENASRRKVSRALGPNAEKATETYFELNVLRTKYEDGDRLAPLEAAVLCRKRNARLPAWALGSLAAGFEKYLSDESMKTTLDQAVLGGKQGRLDPRKAAERRRDDAIVLALLDGAGHAGYRGEEKFGLVRDMLGVVGINIAVDTLRQYQSRLRPKTIPGSKRGAKKPLNPFDRYSLFAALVGEYLSKQYAELPRLPRKRPRSL